MLANNDSIPFDSDFCAFLEGVGVGGSGSGGCNLGFELDNLRATAATLLLTVAGSAGEP